MKQVQISEELFMKIVKYHLAGVKDVEPDIRHELEKKLDAMTRRELYTEYKMGNTEEEREKARKEYLKRRGITEDFKW